MSKQHEKPMGDITGMIAIILTFAGVAVSLEIFSGSITNTCSSTPGSDRWMETAMAKVQCRWLAVTMVQKTRGM